jgi:antitoxin MazE
MHAHLVRIGNSQGVRLPKRIVEEAGLGRDLEISVRKGTVVIRRSLEPRKGWSRAAQTCHAVGDDRLHEWDSAIADGVWQ